VKLQRFPLDRRATLAYLALTVAGCAPNYGPTLRTVLPEGLAPAARDSVLVWVGRTEPTSNQGHRFKWSFKSPDEGVGGVGIVAALGVTLVVVFAVATRCRTGAVEVC